MTSKPLSSAPLSPPPTVSQAAPSQTPGAAPGAASGAAPAPAPIIHHHEVLTLMQTTLTFLVGALFVLTFIVQPYRIPSGSMEPTLLIGDFLLVNKAIFAPPGPWKHLLAYEPVKRDDIVVFHYPADKSLHLVKRVIAVPGDRIHLHNGSVVLNGQMQKEPFALYVPTYPSRFRDDFPTPTYTDPAVGAQWWRQIQRDVHGGNLVVPKGNYFVLGDNRNDSLDSRYWGFVPRQNIVGQPIFVYFSIVSSGKSEITGLPSDRLAHGSSWWGNLAGFARWERTFHIIR